MVEIVLVPSPTLPASVLPDAEILAVAGMLQAWINHEAAPAWSQGQYAVTGVARGGWHRLPSDHVWIFTLEDRTDVAGAGGYHSLDAAGNPYAKIFVGDAKRGGYPWTVILTHEAIEAMVDRFVDACVLASYQGKDSAFFMETGDPFEAGPSYPYHYQGVVYQVCNFCLPAYFKPWHIGPYDRLGLGTAPLTPTQGGRQTVLPLTGQVLTLDHAGKAVPGDADDLHVRPMAGGVEVVGAVVKAGLRVSKLPSGALPAHLMGGGGG